MLDGCASLLLTTRVLTRTQLVLLQDNVGYDNFENRAQSKFVKVHHIQVAEGCAVVVLDYSRVVRTAYKITVRTIMLAVEFGSHQCGQRWSKLKKS
jgi:hypothetical protein